MDNTASFSGYWVYLGDEFLGVKSLGPIFKSRKTPQPPHFIDRSRNPVKRRVQSPPSKWVSGRGRTRNESPTLHQGSFYCSAGPVPGWGLTWKLVLGTWSRKDPSSLKPHSAGLANQKPACSEIDVPSCLVFLLLVVLLVPALEQLFPWWGAVHGDGQQLQARLQHPHGWKWKKQVSPRRLFGCN